MQCKIVISILVFIGVILIWFSSDRFINYLWPREVVFGKKPLVDVAGVGIAHHWAIKVGKTWYEIEGTTISDKGEGNTIALSYGWNSKYGAEPTKVTTVNVTKFSLWILIGILVLVFGLGLFNKKLWFLMIVLLLFLLLRWAVFNEKPGYTDTIGNTRRTDSEISKFNDAFLKNNPTYNVLMSNCQDYVNDLAIFLLQEGDRKGWLPEMESYRHNT